MDSAMIGGAVRALLAALGGILVAQGWTDEETVQQVAGALAVLATVGWSLWAKRKPVDPGRLNCAPFATLAALAMTLALCACAPGAPVASTPTPAPASILPAASTIADSTRLDEAALGAAAKAVRFAALASTAAVRARPELAGTPAALRVADLLDTARDAILAAQAARLALDATGFAEAIERANTAADLIGALIEGN